MSYGARALLSKPSPGVQLDPLHPLSRGLVGYWLFNEGAGSRAQDISGKGNHGTLTDGPAWTGGQRGGALRFDGTDDYVSTPLSMASLSQLTISMWARRSALGAFVYISSNVNNSTQNVQIGFFSDGLVYPTIGDGTFPTVTSNTVDWVHCVMVYNGAASTKLFLYLNGASSTLSAQPTGTATHASAGTFDIGRRLANARYTNGHIDEVRIYTRALTALEVQQLYATPYAGLLGPRRVVPVGATPTPAFQYPLPSLLPSWYQYQNPAHWPV